MSPRWNANGGMLGQTRDNLHRGVTAKCDYLSSTNFAFQTQPPFQLTSVRPQVHEIESLSRCGSLRWDRYHTSPHSQVFSPSTPALTSGFGFMSASVTRH